MIQGNDDPQAAVYFELVSELQQIPVGDVVWLEDFRARAIERIRTTFGEFHPFLSEMRNLLEELHYGDVGQDASRLYI